jgi:hypothetical protein
MTNSNPTSCNVQFRMEKRNDEGFRIYSTDPKGLYVSSSSGYAAAEYFQNFVVFLVISVFGRREVGLEMLGEFDWQDIAEKGSGSCDFITVSEEEMNEEYGPQTGSTDGDFPPKASGQAEIATFELQIEMREIGIKKVLVIQDFSDSDPILEEIIRRQELLQ